MTHDLPDPTPEPGTMAGCADFRYQTLDRKGNLVTVVEDVKGVRTDVYKLKKKLVEYLHKIEITEV